MDHNLNLKVDDVRVRSDAVICGNLTVKGNLLSDDLAALDTRVSVLENSVMNIESDLDMMANAAVSVLAQGRLQPGSMTYSTWTTEVIDSHNAFNGTLFTAPVTAKYFVSFYCFGPNFGAYVEIQRNGSLALAANQATPNLTWGVSGLVELTAGDTLGVWGLQNYTLGGPAQNTGFSIFSTDL